MWDNDKIEALNDFIDALVNLATDVEFSILESEMPQDEKGRLASLQYENCIEQEMKM